MLDATVALAWFLPDEDPAAREYAGAVSSAIEREIAYVVVPLHRHQEVASVLLRRRRAGRLSAQDFTRARQNLAALLVETHMNAYSLEILFERPERYGLQVGDAIYFDLARVLGVPLATLDGGLRTAARAHGVALLAP